MLTAITTNRSHALMHVYEHEGLNVSVRAAYYSPLSYPTTARLSCWRVCCVMLVCPLLSPQAATLSTLTPSASCHTSRRSSSLHRY